MVSLSPQQVQVKQIVYDAGRSYGDAAEWLNLAVGTVRKHADRIRAKHAAAGEPLPDKRRRFMLN